MSKKDSFSSPLFRIRAFIYNQWLNLRFGCQNCNFIYPLNYRCGTEFFDIGDYCKFGKYAVLTAWGSYLNTKYSPYVKIGKNCQFGDFLHLTSINRISIGNGVLTGRWVTITDNSHGDGSFQHNAPAQLKLYSKGPVKIGENVWIGDKVTILPNVSIGEGAIIGANSVVTKDIPSYVIACGNPAKIIKSLKH